MTRRRLARCLFSALGCLVLQSPLPADEIEILELFAAPPATLDGIPAPPPGGSIGTPTLSNSVTVVVRYRLDRGEAEIQAFARDLPTRSGVRSLLVPPTGSEPACGSIRGPAEGRCATAFALVCADSSPSTLSFEEVGAALGSPDGAVVLASDWTTTAPYTVRCPGSSRRTNCMVIGVAGSSGETPLPIGRELPLCRCLRDDAARELRCGILHPDFFLVRRAPLPVRAGRSFSEVWEFLALTELDAPVTVAITGGGLPDPLSHSFGSGGRSRRGKLERFVVQGRVPANATSVPGLARVEYENKNAESDLERAFEVDRTIEVTAQP